MKSRRSASLLQSVKTSSNWSTSTTSRSGRRIVQDQPRGHVQRALAVLATAEVIEDKGVTDSAQGSSKPSPG